MTRNVALLADLPRHARRDDPLASPEEAGERLHVWTVEQVRGFVEQRKAAHDLHWPLWVVAVGTGLRRGEVLGLRWSDVDLDQATIRVRQTVIVIGGKIQLGTPKTAKSRRMISIDPVVIEALGVQRKAQLAERMAHRDTYQEGMGLVFARPDGMPWDPNVVGKRFRRAAEAAGMPAIRFHDLRHTYATLALSAGVAVHIVSKRLGHSTIGITVDTYTHFVPDDDEQAAGRFHAHVWQAGGKA